MADIGGEVSATADTKPEPRLRRKPKSDIWQHFRTEVVDTTTGEQIMRCCHCHRVMGPSTAKNATKLRQHLTDSCSAVPESLKHGFDSGSGAATDGHKPSQTSFYKVMVSESKRPKRLAALNNKNIRHVMSDDIDEDVVEDSMDPKMKALMGENRRLSARLRHCLKKNEALININRYLEESLRLMERIEAINKRHSIRFDDSEEEVAELTDNLMVSNESAQQWRQMLQSFDFPVVKKSVLCNKRSGSRAATTRRPVANYPKLVSTIWKYFQVVENPDYKVIKCNFCEKEFRSKTLNAFQSRLHIVESCDKCPQEIRDLENIWRQKSKVDIWRHFSVTNTGPTGFTASCLYCGHRYSHKNATKGRKHIVFLCKQIPANIREQIRGECTQYYLMNCQTSDSKVNMFTKNEPKEVTAVKPTSKRNVWIHFDMTDKRHPICRYCGHQYMQRNATKCRRHLIANCTGISVETKNAIFDEFYDKPIDNQQTEEEEDKEDVEEDEEKVEDMAIDPEDSILGADVEVVASPSAPAVIQTAFVRHKSRINIWQHFDLTVSSRPICLYCRHQYLQRNATKSRKHLVFSCTGIPEDIKQEIRSQCDERFLRLYAGVKHMTAASDDSLADDYVFTGGLILPTKINRPKSRVWEHFSEETEPDGRIVRRCVYCAEQFESGVSRHAHKIRHHLGIQCPLIPPDVKQTLIGDNVVFARRAMHSIGPKTLYECSWPGCERKYPKPCQLKTHQMDHTGERLACDWPGCEWTGRTAHNLRLHRYIHSGEKPYECDWPGCEFRSARPSSLKIHKLRHRNVLRFRCDWENCDRTFLTGSQLKVHRLTHTGDRPFACQLCDKRYPTLNKLKVHQRKQHSNINASV